MAEPARVGGGTGRGTPARDVVATVLGFARTLRVAGVAGAGRIRGASPAK